MDEHAFEKQFYEYCPIRWYIYHSMTFLLDEKKWEGSKNDLNYKMSVVVKKSSIANRTISLTELRNLFYEAIERKWIQEYDILYDDYIYYRNQIIDVLQTHVSPSIVDIMIYKYNYILIKYLK